ncbi:MAG: SRPBCC domain-containing protein [Pseudomonadota bacterium]
MQYRYLRTEFGHEPVVVEGTFQAPVTRVYRAWTDPRCIPDWFGPKAGVVRTADIDLRVGGRWRFAIATDDGEAALEGEYTTVDTDKCLAFSWRHVHSHADGRLEETPYSHVTVTFRAEGATTHVHLVHAGIVHEEGRQGVGSGWEGTYARFDAWIATTAAPAA